MINLNNTKKISGTYKIKNIVNNKVYIGSSIDIHSRIKQHKSLLIRQKHTNTYLQSSFNKYKEENFVVEIVEDLTEKINKLIDIKVVKAIILSSEQFWIDFYDSCNKSIGYNILKIAGSTLGFKHSKETREKFKNKSGKNHYNYGKKLSKETKAKISKSHMGLDYSKRVLSHETFLKIANTKKQKFASGEYDGTKKYLSILNSGQNHPQSKITEEIVIEIIKQYKRGNITYKALANKYGLSESYIGLLVNGKYWKCLKEKHPELYI